MKMTKKLTHFKAMLLLVVIAVLNSPNPAQADSGERVWPIITFTCDKENNVLKIKNEVKWGESGKIFPFDEKNGTFNPWELVKMEDRGERRLISESRKLDLTCRLFATDYRVVIRPKIFNPNFFASCGDRLSVIVSIYAGDALLLDDKPMEKFCHGNAPVIRGIKVTAESNKVKIYEVSRSRFF